MQRTAAVIVAEVVIVVVVVAAVVVAEVVIVAAVVVVAAAAVGVVVLPLLHFMRSFSIIVISYFPPHFRRNLDTEEAFSNLSNKTSMP